MKSWSDIIATLWTIIKDNVAAIGLLVFDYERAKAKKAEIEKDAAELNLKIEKNHEKVDADNCGKSDIDIVSDEFNSTDDPKK